MGLPFDKAPLEVPCLYSTTKMLRFGADQIEIWCNSFRGCSKAKLETGELEFDTDYARSIRTFNQRAVGFAEYPAGRAKKRDPKGFRQVTLWGLCLFSTVLIPAHCAGESIGIVYDNTSCKLAKPNKMHR